MKILLNGEIKKLDSQMSLNDLILMLKLKSDQIVIELNKDIVSKAQYSTIELKENDEVEIVQMLGGG